MTSFCRKMREEEICISPLMRWVCRPERAGCHAFATSDSFSSRLLMSRLMRPSTPNVSANSCRLTNTLKGITCSLRRLRLPPSAADSVPPGVRRRLVV